jgi:hypothetical protein
LDILAHAKSRESDPIGPIAQADGHDMPRLIDEPVPGVAAMIEQIIVGLEDPV